MNAKDKALEATIKKLQTHDVLEVGMVSSITEVIQGYNFIKELLMDPSTPQSYKDGLELNKLQLINILQSKIDVTVAVSGLNSSPISNSSIEVVEKTAPRETKVFTIEGKAVVEPTSDGAIQKELEFAKSEAEDAKDRTATILPEKTIVKKKRDDKIKPLSIEQIKKADADLFELSAKIAWTEEESAAFVNAKTLSEVEKACRKLMLNTDPRIVHALYFAAVRAGNYSDVKDIFKANDKGIQTRFEGLVVDFKELDPDDVKDCKTMTEINAEAIRLHNEGKELEAEQYAMKMLCGFVKSDRAEKRVSSLSDGNAKNVYKAWIRSEAVRKHKELKAENLAKEAKIETVATVEDNTTKEAIKSEKQAVNAQKQGVEETNQLTPEQQAELDAQYAKAEEAKKEETVVVVETPVKPIAEKQNNNKKNDKKSNTKSSYDPIAIDKARKQGFDAMLTSILSRNHKPEEKYAKIDLQGRKALAKFENKALGNHKYGEPWIDSLQVYIAERAKVLLGVENIEYENDNRTIEEVKSTYQRAVETVNEIVGDEPKIELPADKIKTVNGLKKFLIAAYKTSKEVLTAKWLKNNKDALVEGLSGKDLSNAFAQATKAVTTNEPVVDAQTDIKAEANEDAIMNQAVFARLHIAETNPTLWEKHKDIKSLVELIETAKSIAGNDNANAIEAFNFALDIRDSKQVLEISEYTDEQIDIWYNRFVTEVKQEVVIPVVEKKEEVKAEEKEGKIIAFVPGKAESEIKTDKEDATLYTETNMDKYKTKLLVLLKRVGPKRTKEAMDNHKKFGTQWNDQKKWKLINELLSKNPELKQQLKKAA